MMVKIFVMAVLASWLSIFSSANSAKVPTGLKLVAGYEISVFAHKVKGVRLMVAAGPGRLIVSTYKRGRLVLVEGQKQTVLAKGLNRPHGLVLEGGKLYVAERHRVSVYDFDGKKLSGRRTILKGIPAGGGHASRTLKRGPDGWLYLSVGSSCNVCIEDHKWRAAIIRFKNGVKPQVFASGLRNSVGMDWRPGTNVLYAVNAGRDMLGDDYPREEMNKVEKGKHYGWPFAHENNKNDPTYGKRKPHGLVLTAPAHMFTAHSTPLSIRFLRHQKAIVPGTAALVARHGSWNRSKNSGYDVVRLDWKADGRIVETPFLTGFSIKQEVSGRPVDIIETGDGTLYLSDDGEGVIYKITATEK